MQNHQKLANKDLSWLIGMTMTMYIAYYGERATTVNEDGNETRIANEALSSPKRANFEKNNANRNGIY